MEPNKLFANLATDSQVASAVKSLNHNGVTTFVVENGLSAKEKVMALIPKTAEVFTATSVTLDMIGIAAVINESGDYNSVRAKLASMNKANQERDMARLGAAPEWVIGSVHAVTEDGQVMIASNTGSQLPSYVYAAKHVIWVVGTNKIVADRKEGLERIYEYSLPLESERAKKAYGAAGSSVNKLLIINKEVVLDRITLIFVKENLGY